MVDYYSLNNGKTIPLRVVTYKGMAPIVQFAPKGLDAVDLQNKVRRGEGILGRARLLGRTGGEERQVQMSERESGAAHKCALASMCPSKAGAGCMHVCECGEAESAAAWPRWHGDTFSRWAGPSHMDLLQVQMNQDDSNAAGIPGSWNGWRKML